MTSFPILMVHVSLIGEVVRPIWQNMIKRGAPGETWRSWQNVLGFGKPKLSGHCLFAVCLFCKKCSSCFTVSLWMSLDETMMKPDPSKQAFHFGHRRKIDEPKTPWANSPVSSEDEEGRLLRYQSVVNQCAYWTFINLYQTSEIYNI